MAADVKFAYRDSSTAGAWTTLATTLRFKTADTNSGAATDDPLVRPSSGTNYSFWKNLKVRVVAPADTALLQLRVKSSVATIAGVSGLVLAYAFRTSADYTANLMAVLAARQDVLGTTDVTWSNGRLSSAGAGVPGTAAGNHVTATYPGANEFWGGASGSDQLLLSMEVGTPGGSGGSITPFNLILTYNEI